MKKSPDKVNFEPRTLAVQYYFGDLQYLKMPSVCVESLEHGFDGHALRRLSGLVNPTKCDIRQEEIDSAFRDMGVNAPIPKDEPRLALAADSAQRVLGRHRATEECQRR